jgi:insertion element IS1 protein InsB
VNLTVLNHLNPSKVVVYIQKVEDIEAEIDELWSDVQSKENQRWLWHTIDHKTGKILAYTFGSSER